MPREDWIDLRQPRGSPITTGQLARFVGFSVQTIRREIDAGALTAFSLRHGKRHEWRIRWQDARRYCMRLGIIEEDATRAT
jgi:hypothetical protein